MVATVAAEPAPFASSTWLNFARTVVDVAGVLDEETAEILVRAFAGVPRDRFLPTTLSKRALEDEALPIGFGQRMTKPSQIARMLALVGLRRGQRVFEVGCGSGYTAAIMAKAGALVFSTENEGLLSQQTRKLLDSIGFQNVIVHRGDGRKGWREHAPYEAIVVSTAVDRVDPELIMQLVKPGGRLVAPVGTNDQQVLTLFESKASGVAMYQLESGNFV